MTKDDDEAATPQASGAVVELVTWVREQVSQLRKLARDCLAEVGHHMAGEQYEDGSGEAYKDAYPSYPWGSGDGELAYMAATQPRYVLAQCDAHEAVLGAVQRYLDGHPGPCTNEGFEFDDSCELHIEWNKAALKPYAAQLVGLAYQHCPGYQDSWRP